MSSSMQSAMNYIKRRLSDASFTTNVPNGYMVDMENGQSKTPPKTRNEGLSEQHVPGNSNQVAIVDDHLVNKRVDAINSNHKTGIYGLFNS